MKQIILLLTTLFALSTLQAQSRIDEFSVKSNILGVDKICTVYLPDGYEKSNQNYPVLYLLHGASGHCRSWLKGGNAQLIADEAIAQGRALPMIIVMPDASGEGEKRNGRGMGYFNVPGWEYENFFFGEFIPAIEKHYRIRGDKTNRAIAGLSMGGGGTAVYALRHPETFGSACALSGLLDTIQVQRVYDKVFMRSTGEQSPLRMVRELTDEQAAQQRTVRWWVDCGDDDFLWESNIRFFEAMQRRKIPLEYRMRNGAHNWLYWQATLPDVMTFISTGFDR